VTIVCYRDGIMASDSEISEGQLRVGRVQKAVKMKDGSLVGFCGPLKDMAAWLTWIEKGANVKRRPEVSEEFEVMIVDPEGDVAFVEGNGPVMSITAPFHAIGSGQWVAMGAMGAGASAEEAARIACGLVHSCSEPVTTITV
jgi:ATP-dependent protease HslVU (ClpYQ) peptidase subunit